jgi:hypothetical protein
MAIEPDFTFSANSLQDYLDCPRRFELKYILDQSWPAEESEPVLEFEHHLQLGSQFHQLVYQYLNGLSENILIHSINDPDLHSWFNNFLAYYHNLDFKQTLAEFSIRVPIQHYQVIVVYDLIAVAKDDNLQILDWKTARKKPRKDILSGRIQTILYPYAALEACDHFLPGYPCSPERIQMSYLFVQQTADNVITFNYSQEQHTRYKKYLEDLIKEIQSREPASFERTDDLRRCKYCVYRSLCERGDIAGKFSEMENEEDLTQQMLDIDFDAQDEIAF